MNNSEINSGVNLLCETSLSINSYYENRSKLVDALNKVPKQELTKCLEYYKDRSGVIIDLRKEVIKYLEEGNKVSLEILENLISKHKKGKENQFRSHKKWFSIFYPPITFYGHNALREFTKKFIKKLEDDLQLSNMVSSNVVDFQGARQQGSNTFWLAIYNKSQKNHSTGIQFFIEFNKGKIGYGVYRHSDKTYLKEQMLLVPSNFKYNDLLNYFKTEREELINNFYEKTSSLPDKKDLNMISINRSRPLNTILYGPPGTGKTYNAVKKALEIIKNQTIEDFSENYSEYKEEYDKLRKSGQIEFVTFHQNYSYEEFVEGIKPETDNGKVTYEVKPGVFKRICNNAKMKPTSNFEEAINAFKQFLSEENEAKLHSKVRKAKFSVSYRDGTTFRINPDSQTDQKDYPASIENIRKLYTGESTTSEVYNPTYTLGILEHLYTKYGLRKYDALNQDGNKKKNYMLIIDEINRGNIAKIFGELITLIEPNKRLKVKNYETNGIDESLTVRLPYSPTDEPFGVPDNLYIIGTMNTADRSIALMDIALRRRFVFEEMMPNHNLDSIRTSLDDADINLQELLKTINERIEYLYDRDHMIGHSYFMNINSKDDLDHGRFNKKIISKFNSMPFACKMTW